MLDRSKSRKERLRQEVEVQRRIGQHPHIVELLDVYETPQTVVLVFELMAGELFERLVAVGPYLEHGARGAVGRAAAAALPATPHLRRRAEAAMITRKLAETLRYLHSIGVVHRDLKPENLLMSSKDPNSEIKLADFGLAHLHAVTADSMLTVCGWGFRRDRAHLPAPTHDPAPRPAPPSRRRTWAYSAPEVKIMRKPYSHMVDLWSLGVIVYILLSGFHPFDPQGDANEERLQDNIRNLRYDFNDPVFERVSPNAKGLITGLLQLDPRKRLDTPGVLQHPWLHMHSRLWNRPSSPKSGSHDSTRADFGTGGSGPQLPPLPPPPQQQPVAQRSSLSGAFGAAARPPAAAPRAPRMEIVESLASSAASPTPRRASGSGRGVGTARSGPGAEALAAVAALVRRLQHRSASIELTARSGGGGAGEGTIASPDSLVDSQRFGLATPGDAGQHVSPTRGGGGVGGGTPGPPGTPPLRAAAGGDASVLHLPGLPPLSPRDGGGDSGRSGGGAHDSGRSGGAHDSGRSSGRSGSRESPPPPPPAARSGGGGRGGVDMGMFDASGGGTLTPRASGSTALGSREPSPTGTTFGGGAAAARIPYSADLPPHFWPPPQGSGADHEGGGAVAAPDAASVPRPRNNSGVGDAMLLDGGGRMVATARSPPTASRSPVAAPEESRRRRSLQGDRQGAAAAAAATAADRIFASVRGDAGGGSSGGSRQQLSPPAMWPQAPLPAHAAVAAVAAARPRSAMTYVPPPPPLPVAQLDAALRPRSALHFPSHPQQLGGGGVPSSRSPPSGYATMRPVTGRRLDGPAPMDRPQRLSQGSSLSPLQQQQQQGLGGGSMRHIPDGASSTSPPVSVRAAATAAAAAAAFAAGNSSRQRRRSGTSLAAAAAMLRPGGIPGVPAQPLVFRTDIRPATTPRGGGSGQGFATTPRGSAGGVGLQPPPATTPRGGAMTLGGVPPPATTPRGGAAAGHLTARTYDPRTDSMGTLASLWRAGGDGSSGGSAGGGGVRPQSGSSSLRAAAMASAPLSARDRPRARGEFDAYAQASASAGSSSRTLVALPPEGAAPPRSRGGAAPADGAATSTLVLPLTARGR